MNLASTPDLRVIQERVIELAAEIAGIPREKVHPHSRLIQDLQLDSLDAVEMTMALESEFAVNLDYSNAPIPKSIFTRNPFRLSDLAELIYLNQGTGIPTRSKWTHQVITASTITLDVHDSEVFTQLSGIWSPGKDAKTSLFEPLNIKGGPVVYRRRTDGMRCILIPEAEVEIGSHDRHAELDQQPLHTVRMDSFLIDAEPVSTTAWCRFLNSIAGATSEHIREWFIPAVDDHRREQLQVSEVASGWQPLIGTEWMPMVLVSWFGANAYSLWANGLDWRQYDVVGAGSRSSLPTEAQWEYAARGPRYQEYPSPESISSLTSSVVNQHQSGKSYTAATMPMAPVNKKMGMSPFGLHHMAGNIWQWCRDWYDASFYSRSASTDPNPVNELDTGVKSERGGSWVGPVDLSRSSYRRGRAPEARGRCLGFRCISDPEALKP